MMHGNAYHVGMEMKPRRKTTAADLIAQLQQLPPDTYVYVDIGYHDWGYSDYIQVVPSELGEAGAYYLQGIEG